MDRIFDRLGNLLRSVFPDSERSAPNPGSYGDPDLEEAWEELNEFMESDGDATTQGKSAPTPTRVLPPLVAEAYRTIGVGPDASNGEIGKAYKALILRHHPDRFATDQAKLLRATERTKQINGAFQEIKNYRADHPA